eukprot:CAMPEP_0197033304 /NCGR_PEP_ID=MMETSP1384-20130603/11752_1 /TAXON_ID=29189 /ORGANISM="Ammonia sp." /LENGTH=205 /DNA_ID=CAMNT_0042463093 /DNA_START=40 /DNA_END=657 /DNA_ORIENTATION=-
MSFTGQRSVRTPYTFDPSVDASTYSQTSMASGSTTYTLTYTTARRREKKRCCKCMEIRVGIFALGLWSILVTNGYYIGFLMMWCKNATSSTLHYPVPVLYALAGLGFIGGSVGIFASILQSLLFVKVFFAWAILHFFGQFIEGILYAAAGYNLYIIFFIDFVLWGYFIIVINTYMELLKQHNNERRLMINNQVYYQSMDPTREIV